ncbi:hypothetical protein MN032_17675 [Agromyces atrinae]|uniref:ATP-binding protein n=1 Tax=Agromyces atrinae TaxID=592376 RepID=UPI001F5823C0|nr:ATP-binding protein [Agromyces atrinae]MCI2959518.1 hypothetical protein [Agromyces atrinae]
MTQTFAVNNFKGVREIELSPSGSLVVIAGANGAGKSSFIDAFVELFDPKGVRLTPKPIREGEAEAVAEFTDTDLGVRIVRTWKKADAGKLEVFALDGARYGKPAEVVARLTGGLIFDPVAFLSLDEKKQRDALLAKVDLPIDLDVVAREKSGAEGRRLDAGREVKRLEGAIASTPAPAAGLPSDEQSASDVVAELEKAQEFNAGIRQTGEHLGAAEIEFENAERAVAELRERLSAAERFEIDARETLAACRAKYDALGDPIDLEPIRARLANVEETNAEIRAAKQRADLQTQLAAAQADHEAAQKAIDAIDADKRAALSKAKFPVAGLSVDDDGITFEGIPFVQVNSAARRAAAFGIATAGNPDLRLVIIKDGDLLDSESLGLIERLAEQRGYTVLVERDRDESREIGFTIVDGALTEAAA